MVSSTPPPNSTTLSEHQHRIDCCRGIICFEEVARNFGTRSSNQLEVLIDDFVPSIDVDGRKIWPGKYRKWLSGTAPSSATLSKVDQKTGGKSQLSHWRKLILWNLIEEPVAWDLTVISHFTMYLQEPARTLARRVVSPDSLGRYLSTEIVLEVMLELRDLYTLDAFMALLLLAREAKLIKSEQRFVLATTSAFEVFPRVVMAHVHLQVCWERLYRCVEFAFWSRVYLEDDTSPFSIEIVRRQMAVKREIPR